MMISDEVSTAIDILDNEFAADSSHLGWAVGVLAEWRDNQLHLPTIAIPDEIQNTLREALETSKTSYLMALHIGTDEPDEWKHDGIRRTDEALKWLDSLTQASESP